jgi:undecaprenyl-diphosphatase
MLMNAFDVWLTELVNRLAQHSPSFDRGVVLLSNSYLLKGGVVMALYVWAWFDTRPDQERRRSTLICSLLAAIGAVVLARGLAHLLPFRERPIYSTSIDFARPIGDEGESLIDWSSFPSDHATLFTALAAGLWFAHRTLGTVVYVYVAVAICLPRLYLGIHWPSDLLVGAGLGFSIAWVATRQRVTTTVAPPLLGWKRRWPGPFYAVIFLLAFEIVTLFDDARAIASWASETLRG